MVFTKPAEGLTSSRHPAISRQPFHDFTRRSPFVKAVHCTHLSVTDCIWRLDANGISQARSQARCNTGRIVCNTRANHSAGKVRQRWAKACYVRSRSGGTHNTASVWTTRTHSLPTGRHRSPRTHPTLTGKANSRARKPRS